MPTERDTLYRLQKKDVARAAQVLADAFQHDPVWNAMFGDAWPGQRIAAFETPVLYGLKYGAVYASSENLEGIAVWMPGEWADMTLWRVFRSGAMWSGLKLGFRVAQKMTPIFQPIETDRKENVRKPFIYLQVIGVAPQFQGQGLGGRLLRALIEESEQAGLPIYLETETEGNVRMYEHLGFTVVKNIMLPIIHLPMWEMLRESEWKENK